MNDDKGQIHTIEGFTAAFILILAMMYGVQSIAITPTSSSTASQEVELNNYKLTDDILASSNANGELREALLYWNTSSESFEDTGPEDGHYRGTSSSGLMGNPVPENLGLHETLNKTLTQRGIAYNIDLRCGESQERYAENGQASNHAVTATTTVVLHEHDRIHYDGGEQRLDDADNFVCDNVSDDSSVYSVIEVRLTAWRM